MMAVAKKEVFGKSTVELAELTKSLSHPARLMILNVLAKHKDRTCKELVAELPLSQPTVSQHLKGMLETGLICRTQHGAQSLYCIEWNRTERFFNLIDRMRDKLMPSRPKRNCC